MLTLLFIHSISIYLALINLLDSMKYIKMRCIPDLSKNMVEYIHKSTVQGGIKQIHSFGGRLLLFQRETLHSYCHSLHNIKVLWKYLLI